MKAQRAPTIRDVARASDVSIATVTRVVQESTHVTEETRARVKAAIERLGYRPNALARALVTGTTTRTLGLLIPTSSDSYWGEIAAGVEARARKAGYSVLLGHTGRSPEQERELVALFLGKRVDGLILAGVSNFDGAWLREARHRVPLVFIGRDKPTSATPRPRENRNSVEPVPAGALERALRSLRRPTSSRSDPPVFLADDRRGAGVVVSHLLDLGHRKIGFIAGQLLEPSLRMIQGIRDSLKGAKLWPCAIWRCEETLEGGRLAAIAMLKAKQRPTALFGYNDIVAIGAMRGAHELGLDVPHDVSVIGFDDIEAAAFVQPALSSLRVPKFEFGWRAVEALIAGEVQEPARPDPDMPPVGLVLRESTAPPKARA